MLAYSYRRFSHKQQAAGSSIIRQLERTEAYCARKGYTLDNTLTLEDCGVSAFRGKNAERGALAVFLEAVKSGTVNTPCILIVESLDRVSRQDIELAGELFKDILRQGVTVCTLSPEREYDRQSLKRLGDVIEFTLIMSRAHEESQTKSDRVLLAWDKKRHSGKPITSVCPMWLLPQKGKFVVNPDRAGIVKRMFNMVLEGHSITSIVKAFNAENIPDFSGKGWHHVYVQRTLRSKTTIGEFQPQRREGNKRHNVGEAIKGYYPAVVEEDAFWRVQGILNGRQKIPAKKDGKDVANLFSGLLHDARDGYSMRVVSTKGGKKGVKIPYLVSTGAMNGNKGSKYATVNYNYFELSFLHFVKELKLDAPTTKTANELESLEVQMKAVQERSENLQAELEDPNNSEILPNLSKALRTVKEQGKNLQEAYDRAKAAQTNNTESDVDELQNMLSRYEDAINAGKTEEFRIMLRNKIRQIVESIWVLVEVENKYNRTVSVQIYFKDGSKRMIELLITRAGLEMASMNGDLNLKHYRER